MIPFDDALRSLLDEYVRNGESIEAMIIELECEAERLFTLPEYEAQTAREAQS